VTTLTLDIESLRKAFAAPAIGRKTAIDAREARNAGVTIPLTLAPTLTAHLLVRADHLRDHAGEVGFPGGKVESYDENPRATALRETEEEVGIARADLDILGELEPVPVINGRFLIHAFPAALREGVVPRVNSPEIGRLLSAPVAPWIFGTAPIYGIQAHWHGQDFVAPHFDVDGALLYGASAYVFYEMLWKIAVSLGREMPTPILQDEPPWGNRYSRSSAKLL
jgi:8-oxo-dGTP pyrophosphatase MutT (NUDIX family)